MRIQQIQNKKLVKLTDMKAGDCFIIEEKYAHEYTWPGVNIRTSDCIGVEGEEVITCVQLEHGHIQIIPAKDEFEVVNAVVQILPDEEIPSETKKSRKSP